MEKVAAKMMTTPAMCQLVGCSFRMADYWERVGLITPEVAGRGSGSKRLWTVEQAATCRVVFLLAELRCPATVIRTAIDAIDATPELWSGVVVVTPTGRVLPIGVASG